MCDLISVIVPVYGVELYLDKCVDSIVRQTYKNLEIILVDDGSPDNCPRMCDRWAERDSRIFVIHKENGGLSDARNVGMMKAKGMYICFIDSDDFLDTFMLESLYNTALNYSAEVVECEWDEFTDLNCAPETNYSANDVRIEFFTSTQAIEENIKENRFKQTVVNKIYLTEIAKQVLFPKGKIHEDEYWTYKVLANASVCVHIPLKMYHSFIRQGSIMNSGYSLMRLHGLEAKKERAFYISEHFPQLSVIAFSAYLDSCRYAFQCICRNRCLDKKRIIRKNLICEFRLYFSKYCYKELDFKQRMWIYLFYFFPFCSSGLRNAFKIGI